MIKIDLITDIFYTISQLKCSKQYALNDIIKCVYCRCISIPKTLN